MMLAGRQQGDELLAQLRELFYLPSPTSIPPVNKVVESGGDGRQRRRRRGSKRDRDEDDDKTNTGQQDVDEPAAAARRHSCKARYVDIYCIYLLLSPAGFDRFCMDGRVKVTIPPSRTRY